MKPEHRMPGRHDTDKPIGELLRELYQDVSMMIDRQIALAKHEASAAANAAGKGVAVIAAGALVGLVGFIYLMLAAIYALSRVMPDWAAALVVGLVLAGIGAACAMAGVKKLRAVTQPLPETRETLKEDAGFAKEEARDLAREIRGR
jgi:uncharacterized membrane protein YqjE